LLPLLKFPQCTLKVWVVFGKLVEVAWENEG
jgi:hypothetical protein